MSAEKDIDKEVSTIESLMATTEGAMQVIQGMLDQVTCDISTQAAEIMPSQSVTHSLADLSALARPGPQPVLIYTMEGGTSAAHMLYTEPGPNPLIGLQHWGGGSRGAVRTQPSGDFTYARGGRTRPGHPAPGQLIDAYVEECPDPVWREPDWDDHSSDGPWARRMSRTVYEHERRTGKIVTGGAHRGLYGITHDGPENGCRLCGQATVRSLPEAAAVAGSEIHAPAWSVRWWQYPWFFLLRLVSHRGRRAPLDWAEVNRMERQEGLVLTRPWREEALAPEKR